LFFNQQNLSWIKLLSICHVLLLATSNLLVQYPFHLFGYHTTWGAFTYPAIFILTDLTTRLSSAQNARLIIFKSMLPGLLISYVIASYMEVAAAFSWHSLLSLHPMPLRIAFACFFAYVTGQLLDIFIFQRLRNKSSWWIAPSLSTIVGNLIDTILFFSIAFYHCSNPYLNQHWPEIAVVDMFFKVIISLIAFVPMYGVVLSIFHKKMNSIKKTATSTSTPLGD
jgi:uncharacterized integral membrane protein (TIGR00697 family)